jgi:hypothetical protein
MEQLLPMLIVLPLLVFWMWMFWDMSKNDDLSANTKNTWALWFLVLNIFAAGYYYANVYRNRS